ncbi:MAG: SelL-related redox protein [Verrucomicrobiota bacterium]
MTDSAHSSFRTPNWARKALLAAGIYNVLWGAWVVLFPGHWFSILGIESPRYPELWQCIGMIVGCYGVGYLIASFHPVRFWPITIVGLLGKVLGPIGFIWALIQGSLPPGFGWMILFNDLIWWVPFTGILVIAYEYYLGDLGVEVTGDISLLERIRTFHGKQLHEQSFDEPVMLIFLRHAGCTFCREALSDISKIQEKLKKRKVTPVFVHMSDGQRFEELLAEYKLEGIDHMSDPKKELYRAFELKRGTWFELFGKEVWQRGWQAAVIDKLGVGWLDGDGFQMPGVFLLEHGEVTFGLRHSNAAERPDYLEIANTATAQ